MVTPGQDCLLCGFLEIVRNPCKDFQCGGCERTLSAQFVLDVPVSPLVMQGLGRRVLGHSDHLCNHDHRGPNNLRNAQLIRRHPASLFLSVTQFIVSPYLFLAASEYPQKYW